MYENKHDEINYRNKLAKMNIEKAEIFLAKKNKTSLDEAKAIRHLVNAAYHEAHIQLQLGNPIYRDKTEKEIFKMAEHDLLYSLYHPKADVSKIRIVHYVKNLFKKKDINEVKK